LKEAFRTGILTSIVCLQLGKIPFPDVPKTKPAKDRKRFRVFGPTFVIRPKSIETNLAIVTFGTRFKNITSFKARSGSKSEKEQQRSKK
jgi:hypothetical protein